MSSIAFVLAGNMVDSKRSWSEGAVVYQVFVDRFAPSAHLDAKRNLYAAPRGLRSWSETPKSGHLNPSAGVWSHELEFWGGDLKSVESKLDYVNDLGADVLYLTPIFQAATNHKYDTQDYFKIAPEFGTRKDLDDLTKAAHKRRIRLVLDGVFNHIGRTAPLFEAAKRDPKDPHRKWFTFNSKLPNGYKGWVGVANLPAWNLENPETRDYLWNRKDSVVRSYLRGGIDGWRLDVGFELGPTFLHELTTAAHAERSDSFVVGEILGYPADWNGVLDGVFNYAAPRTVIEAIHGKISGGRATRMLDRMVQDMGLSQTLKSWLHLDNHDSTRIASILPDFDERKLAWAALFTLPGSPVVYYGSELSMTGEGDPANRAPMRWDLATAANQNLAWVRRLIQIRKAHPSLRYGDFRALETDKLIAFARTTDKLLESAVVVMNPTNEELRETIAVRIGHLMSWGGIKDAIAGDEIRVINGFAEVKMAPRSVRIYCPTAPKIQGATQYDRIP